MFFALICILIQSSTVFAQSTDAIDSDPGWSGMAFRSELYIGEQARRAILPRKSFVEVVFAGPSGARVVVEGRVVSMTDLTLTLASNRDVPLSQVTRILVASSKAELKRTRSRFFGQSVQPASDVYRRFKRRSTHFVQLGFGGLIADSDDDFTTIHLLAGTEAVYAGRLGLLAEIGFGAPMALSRYFTGLATLNAVVHPMGRRSSIDQYLTAGWTVAFISRGLVAWNAGVGFTAVSGN